MEARRAARCERETEFHSSPTEMRTLVVCTFGSRYQAMTEFCLMKTPITTGAPNRECRTRRRQPRNSKIAGGPFLAPFPSQVLDLTFLTFSFVGQHFRFETLALREPAHSLGSKPALRPPWSLQDTSRIKALICWHLQKFPFVRRILVEPCILPRGV